jgi:peptidyl-Lys metalloendopeptidase
MTGTDSMAGTIIHEVAHFKVVAGTTDHAYGHSAAKSLAVSNPTNALANSDSLQYYAENNPRL